MDQKKTYYVDRYGNYHCRTTRPRKGRRRVRYDPFPWVGLLLATLLLVSAVLTVRQLRRQGVDIPALAPAGEQAVANADPFGAASTPGAANAAIDAAGDVAEMNTAGDNAGGDAAKGSPDASDGAEPEETSEDAGRPAALPTAGNARASEMTDEAAAAPASEKADEAVVVANSDKKDKTAVFTALAAASQAPGAALEGSGVSAPEAPGKTAMGAPEVATEAPGTAASEAPEAAASEKPGAAAPEASQTAAPEPSAAAALPASEDPAYLPIDAAAPVAGAEMPEPRAFEPAYRTLRQGDYARAVTQVQDRLRALGFLKLSGSSTTFFGEKTAKAVADFQTEQGLEATGEADPETLRRLFAAGEEAGA